MFHRIAFFMFLHITLFHTISEQSPIIGETVEVEKDEFRKDFSFVASIGDLSILGVHKKRESHHCGGVLITKRHVLTASHCLRHQEIHKILVTLGSTVLNCGLSYEVKSWVNYTNWAKENRINVTDLDAYDDIAIITLSSDVNHIKPAVISKLNESQVIEQQLVTVGWGRIDDINETRPMKLRKLYLNVLNSTKCVKIHRQIYKSSNLTHINSYCTYSVPLAYIYYGDSGTPLLLDSTKEVVGISTHIVIRRRLVKLLSVTSVYIKVQEYEHFINDVVSQ
ncbi:chymotrypsin-2-like [Phymastichus coffea]|uniref:chymotrypsin-2-like n=1 Tax=Phymastichus coffea TaxID=108790 RepID=UPI00273C272B|nr:chymotrypsin-2-like [Phymastichus coffea]